jgi:ribosome-associated protein
MIRSDDAPNEDADRNERDSGGARPSRTEQTRAAAAVNQLGVRLTTLSPAELERLDLPERLREEIEASRRLKPRSRGRQNRLIGQLLRAEDHEAIRERLESLKRARRDGVNQEKVTERWLVRLIDEGQSAVEALIDDYPLADRQRLRSLARTARKDPGSKVAKRARRDLLRAIRALRA